MEHLTRICAMFGATPDDYSKALERPLGCSTPPTLYNAMVRVQPPCPRRQNRPASPTNITSRSSTRLLEGSERAVNIAG
jgi:hypothetical protein